MNTVQRINKQITEITAFFVGTELCSDQNFSYINGAEINVNSKGVATALKKRPYAELYAEMNKERNYNLKLIDGALLLLQYRFDGETLDAHRLCFFPNPERIIFQECPEEYLEDDIYLDIIDPRNVVVPIRFDYDSREGSVKEVIHPAAHMTLGQYENCRIPVSRPLTPYQFISFVIRNFYNYGYRKYEVDMPFFGYSFPETIFEKEKEIVYVNV